MGCCANLVLYLPSLLIFCKFSTSFKLIFFIPACDSTDGAPGVEDSLASSYKAPSLPANKIVKIY